MQQSATAGSLLINKPAADYLKNSEELSRISAKFNTCNSWLTTVKGGG